MVQQESVALKDDGFPISAFGNDEPGDSLSYLDNRSIVALNGEARSRFSWRKASRNAYLR